MGFTRKYRLFKFFGIPVYADISWIFLGVLITWSLARGYFPRHLPGLDTRLYWQWGGLVALGVFVSVLLHEISHSLTARAFRIKIKGVTLFVFGGMAEMEQEPKRPGAEFWTALAGPLASGALGVLFLALSHYLTQPNTGIHLVVFYLGYINIFLAGFNIIPAFPLDGGRVLRSILWKVKKDYNQATIISAQAGGVLGFLMFVFAIIQLLNGRFLAAIWIFLIGLFIRGAATGQVRQLVVRRFFGGKTVADFMTRNVVSLTPDLTLKDFVEQFAYRYHHKMYPVLHHGKLMGRLVTRRLKLIEPEHWAGTYVRELMEPFDEHNTIQAGEDALKALNRMQAREDSRLMVRAGEKLVGVVSLKDFLDILTLKMDLEGGDPTRIASPDAPPEISK